jgi:hypothetical protein
MSQKENWAYGVVKEDKPKLQPLLDALRKLHLRRLIAGMVAAAFHRRRVLPLMQRRLRLDKMKPDVSLEGSRMSHETLPLDEVVQRGRWVMGSFKQEDIDKVPMRPNQGFEPLVSVVFSVLSSPSSPRSRRFNPSSFLCRICQRSRNRRHRSRRIAPLDR